MSKLSMTRIWDETREFVGRELPLLLPVGLATLGLGTLMFSLAGTGGPAPSPGQMPEAGPWMFWLIPAVLLLTIGYLAISAIALRPQISVREALGEGIARLPSALALTLIAGGAIFVAMMIVAFVMAIVARGMGMGAQEAVSFSFVILLVPLVWASLRLVLIWPVMVGRRCGPIEALRGSIAVTRGHAARIAGVMAISIAVNLLVVMAIQLAAGSLFVIIGRMIDSPAFATTMTAVLLAAAVSALGTVWTVYLAFLYRAVEKQG